MQTYDEIINSLYHMATNQKSFDHNQVMSAINFITYQRGVIDGMQKAIIASDKCERSQQE